MQKSANALSVRRADLRALREVVATGLLDPGELHAARRAIARVRRTILIRTVLAVVLGRKRSARLIDRLRQRF